MKVLQQIFVRIIICILILILILGITIIIFLKKNNIHMIHGKVTTHFGDMEYNDGTFLIDTSSSIYMDPSFTLESAKAQFHIELRESDNVYTFCKISSREIAPIVIKIFYIIRL